MRNATSNTQWGPSMSELQEICLLTYTHEYCVQILSTLEKRLNDDGKSWRHISKALVIVQFLMIQGSDEVVQWARNHRHLVKTLREFKYADSRNIDRGGPIRSKAREISLYIDDPDKLEREKANYKRIRQEMYTPGIVDLDKTDRSRMSTDGTSWTRAAGKTRLSLDYDGRKSNTFVSRRSLTLHSIAEEAR